jgi:hypothetical protein
VGITGGKNNTSSDGRNHTSPHNNNNKIYFI